MRGIVPRTVGLSKVTPGLVIPPKNRRTMDVGTKGGTGPLPSLLAVYDSSGLLSTQATAEAPFGCVRAVIRCQGPGNGGGGSDSGYGSDPRTMSSDGSNGGAFAKRNVVLRQGQTVTARVDTGSVSIDGTLVCSATAMVGDLIRYGGYGGGPGEGGSDGDHGATGDHGGTMSGYYTIWGPTGDFIKDAYFTDIYGGSGGSAGDFGDPDGVGFGWSPSNGQRLVGTQPARITIHFYSQ